MRSFLTYGLVSLVGVAALYACGDDSGDGTGAGGAAGTGGTAGAGGGTAGTVGMSGAGGSTAGTGGTGPVASVPPNCAGCVEIEIPFAAASQAALYQIVYPAPGLDFSNATISWAVQLLAGADPNLFVKLQIQNGMAANYAGYYNAPTQALTAAAFPPGTFVNVTLNTATIPALGGGGGVGDAGAADGGTADAGDAGVVAPPPAAGTFDKSKVEQLQIQFGSTAAFTGTQNLAVEIDGVTLTGVPGNTGVTFTSGVEGLVLNNYPNSPTPVGTGAPAFH